MGATTGIRSEFMIMRSTSASTRSGSPTKPRSTGTRLLVAGSSFVRSAFFATTMFPSLPDTPTARPPAALMPVTICLLIKPDSTISTTSMVAASVTRSPSTKVEVMLSFFSIAPI